jgi:hypothetical protein
MSKNRRRRMDNKTISVSITSGIEKRVSECHGWCEIKDLSGDMEEGLFLATFADDSRIVFEDDQDGFLHLHLTRDQEQAWNNLYEEERIETLEEILLFYHRYMKEKGGKIKGVTERTKYEVTLLLTVDSDDFPDHWDWPAILNLTEVDVALTKCEEVHDG